MKASDFEIMQDKVNKALANPKQVTGLKPFHIYIGIDPGWTGAIVINAKDTLATDNYKIFKCPSTVQGMYELLKWNLNIYKCQIKPIKIFAMIEKIHGRGSGSYRPVKWSSKTTFRFGENYGAWHALLTSYNARIIFINPQQWQKRMLGKFARGKSKETSLRVAKQRHPELAKKIGKNHNIADAINICELCEWYFRSEKE